MSLSVDTVGQGVKLTVMNELCRIGTCSHFVLSRDEGLVKH